MEFYLPIAEMSINPIGFLILGIIVGTYSSIFVATPVFVDLFKKN